MFCASLWLCQICIELQIVSLKFPDDLIFCKQVVTEFKENGFNTAPYYENNKKKKVVNIVPTSAERCDN